MPGAVQSVRRCRDCWYVLEHLPESRCPECGTAFDFADPSTYTTKPPFVWHRFWMPPLVVIMVMLFVIGPMLVGAFGWGVSTVIVLPACLGVLAGFASRGVWIVAAFFLTPLAYVVGFGMQGLVGFFCMTVLAGAAFFPILIGACFGAILRHRLRRSRWGHAPWLPLLAIMLVPALSACLEGRRHDLPIVTTETIQIVDASPEATWAAVQFYEEVRHPPPSLLRLSPSLRPVSTQGRSEQVGDRKICVYERGRLIKEITDVVPGQRLSFRVVEQTDIENNSVRLIGGSFSLEPIDGGRRTRVTLTTKYEPLLAPRLLWQPAEDLAVHTLHGHVLEGMRRDAEER